MLSTLKDRFDKNFQLLINVQDLHDHIAVAVSGGSDSIALLFLLSSWCKKSNTKLSVLSVNHNLRPQACDEIHYVRNLAEELKHDFYKLSWDAGITKSSIQERARKGRYDLMSKKCKELGIKTLLTAHHFDDMLETYLMRRHKKSGIFGLSSSYSFFYKDIQVLRPLFDIRKNDLITYLKENKIEWIEDSSNQSDLYERNRVRKKIALLPSGEKYKLEGELNEVNKKVKDLTKNLISGIAESVEINNCGFAIIDLTILSGFHFDIIVQILNYVLTVISGKESLPRYRNLEKLPPRLTDTNLKCSLHGCIVKKILGNKLIIFREESSICSSEVKLNSKEHWDNRFEILFTEEIGDDYVIDSLKLPDYVSIKDKLNLHEFKKFSYNNHKSILFTLPIIKNRKKIVAIPSISYYDDCVFEAAIEVIFRPNFTSRFTHFF